MSIRTSDPFSARMAKYLTATKKPAKKPVAQQPTPAQNATIAKLRNSMLNIKA